MSRPQTLALPPGTRAYRLDTARGEFAVLECGAARQGTVLLVPGFTGSKEDFIGLLAPLARAGFRAVAVDGRGQFESGGPRDEAAYAQPELAQDVLAQAAALGGEPTHVLGHSLGGQIARAAVLLDPAPFVSLTLMSSGPAALSAGEQVRMKMLLGALPVLDMAAIWQAMNELGPPETADPDPSSAFAGEPPAAVREFLYRRWMANVPEQLLATGRQLLVEPDRVAELAAVPLPKHVLSGAVDAAWPVPLMDDMARRLDARRTVIPDTEHSPNAARPEPTAAELIAFFSDVDVASTDRPRAD